MIFKDEDLVLQITEADQITALAHLGGARFGYALRNSTVGVYDGATRLWRVKSKHGVAGAVAFDLDGDGTPELVSGWSNGRVSCGARFARHLLAARCGSGCFPCVLSFELPALAHHTALCNYLATPPDCSPQVEARHAVTGEVVHRDSLGSPVAALLRGDLRGTGEPELIVLGTQGEVRCRVWRIWRAACVCTHAAARPSIARAQGRDPPLFAPTSARSAHRVPLSTKVRGYVAQSDELHVDAGDISLQQQALVELAQKKQVRPASQSLGRPDGCAPACHLPKHTHTPINLNACRRRLESLNPVRAAPNPVTPGAHARTGRVRRRRRHRRGGRAWQRRRRRHRRRR